MSEGRGSIRTEVHGLEVCLGNSVLALARDGEPLIPPIVLNATDADRLRLEMAKAGLWEWNRFVELERKAEKRYKHCLASWLVLCLAAFSAFVGYPNYVLPLLLTALSIFIWCRAGYLERQDEKAAHQLRNVFVPGWDYFRQRAEEPEALR